MMMRTKIFSVLLIAACALTGVAQVPAQDNKTPPESLPGSQPYVYKTASETKLLLHVFQPADKKAGEARPAIVLFFGGGFRNGTARAFLPQAQHLAARGMVVVLPDYRVQSRQGVTPLECYADAKSAMRWVRAHAKEQGIDPQRIAAGGGSAGGMLALVTALLSGFDDKSDDLKISPAPNALVLFNPGLDTAGSTGRFDWGGNPKAASPLQNVRAGAPPAIVFHGTEDKAVPYQQAVEFCAAMKKAGNRCELMTFEGRGHSFFNPGRGDGSDFRATLKATDEFLVSLGYLKAQPASN